ncbi:MAG: hypothetical protein HC767_15575 [Akkermansiaceae bacterium]|nr:hypothetical protein [Akkermansiaceae bacterium]
MWRRTAGKETRPASTIFSRSNFSDRLAIKSVPTCTAASGARSALPASFPLRMTSLVIDFPWIAILDWAELIFPCGLTVISNTAWSSDDSQPRT